MTIRQLVRHALLALDEEPGVYQILSRLLLHHHLALQMPERWIERYEQDPQSRWFLPFDQVVGTAANLQVLNLFIGQEAILLFYQLWDRLQSRAWQHLPVWTRPP